jgi:hypothetical protein
VSELPNLSTVSGKWPRLLAKAQGIFYLVTGIWPLIGDDTFQLVTGYKADFWLAQIVGLILAVIGLVLYLAARADRLTREIVLLAVLSAAALLGADIYAPFQPHTTRAYFLDAFAELGILTAWSCALTKGRGPSSR